MAERKVMPTHRLKLRDNRTDRSAEVGAGWRQVEGHITIQLNPGTNLNWVELREAQLTLFPVDKPHNES